MLDIGLGMLYCRYMKILAYFFLYILLALPSVWATKEDPPSKEDNQKTILSEWGGEIPHQSCISCEEVEDENYLLPVPDAHNPIFSRTPALPYYDNATKSFIIEYIAHPLCRDGVATFYIKQIRFQDEGTTIIVTTHRIQAPASKPDPFSVRWRFKSQTPYVYKDKDRMYVFSCAGELITACDMYQTTTPNTLPRFIKRLFPAPYQTIGKQSNL